jgi:hypothetical protein
MIKILWKFYAMVSLLYNRLIVFQLYNVKA